MVKPFISSSKPLIAEKVVIKTKATAETIRKTPNQDSIFIVSGFFTSTLIKDMFLLRSKDIIQNDSYVYRI